MVFAKSFGEEGMECIEWVESQFYKMKSILEIDGGDGCTTSWMYWISWTVHLKMTKDEKKMIKDGKFSITFILPQ